MYVLSPPQNQNRPCFVSAFVCLFLCVHLKPFLRNYLMDSLDTWHDDRLISGNDTHDFSEFFGTKIRHV